MPCLIHAPLSPHSQSINKPCWHYIQSISHPSTLSVSSTIPGPNHVCCPQIITSASELVPASTDGSSLCTSFSASLYQQPEWAFNIVDQILALLSLRFTFQGLPIDFSMKSWLWTTVPSIILILTAYSGLRIFALTIHSVRIWNTLSLVFGMTESSLSSTAVFSYPKPQYCFSS